MTNLPRLRLNDLVVVADGRKALLLVNQGPPDALDLSVLKTLNAGENPPDAEQQRDRPGRVQKSGGRRSAVEQIDKHQQTEDEFAFDVVRMIPRTTDARVVFVAPPKFLAALRNARADENDIVVLGDIDKDLTHLPVDKLSRALTGG